jgi:hypothetical protein
VGELRRRLALAEAEAAKDLALPNAVDQEAAHRLQALTIEYILALELQSAELCLACMCPS